MGFENTAEFYNTTKLRFDGGVTSFERPTIDRLYRTFQTLMESSYKGVRGIIKIEGKRPGPTLGITVCTHGNEPAGLAAAQYALDTFKENREDLAGTIYIVVNNPFATEAYFHAMFNGDVETARKARAIEVNMNRIPEGAIEDLNDERPEIMRIRELKPIFDEFDVGVDFHSTLKPAPPMIVVPGSAVPYELLGGMPIKIIVSGIGAVQIGQPISELYGSKNKKSVRFVIEAGQHESSEAFQNAIFSLQIILENLQMVPGGHADESPTYTEYSVFDSVVFPDNSYRLAETFNNFQFVQRGTVLARSTKEGLRDIVAPQDCFILFPKNPNSIANDEAMFLATKQS